MNDYFFKFPVNGREYIHPHKLKLLWYLLCNHKILIILIFRLIKLYNEHYIKNLSWKQCSWIKWYQDRIPLLLNINQSFIYINWISLDFVSIFSVKKLFNIMSILPEGLPGLKLAPLVCIVWIGLGGRWDIGGSNISRYFDTISTEMK